MEYIRTFNKPEAVCFMVDKNCSNGYSHWIAQTSQRDRTAADTVIEDPVIVAVAERWAYTCVVCLKWAIQRGEVIIPFSVTPSKLLPISRRLKQSLTSEEMEAISKIDNMPKTRYYMGRNNGWEIVRT